MTIVPVRNEVHRSNAHTLISEYLHWIGESARREYGLRFDVDAMVESDMSDTQKFHPPTGRFRLSVQRGLHGDEPVSGLARRWTEVVGRIRHGALNPHGIGGLQKIQAVCVPPFVLSTSGSASGDKRG